VLAEPMITRSAVAGYPLLFRGKVRDVYDLGDVLLFVATDRISAFDVVLPTPIPDKGKVLTQLSAFWFRQTGDLIPNHLLSTDVATYPGPLPSQEDVLAGRSMLVRKARRIDVECVVRGYLAGSAWVEYQRSGTVGGLPLGPGLRQSERFDQPLFTPTTKAAVGHDQPITIEEMAARVGGDLTQRIARTARDIYLRAHDEARTRGLILADTKLEFGIVGDELTLIDELLTPDSSRFWDAERYEVGRSQPSYDKQFVRDWLEASGWDKTSDPPTLPPDIIERTSEKYREAYRRLVGTPLDAR
jgi:phosphoribosylaminoimidazole-succinocarboxamide synthase